MSKRKAKRKAKKKEKAKQKKTLRDLTDRIVDLEDKDENNDPSGYKALLESLPHTTYVENHHHHYRVFVTQPRRQAEANEAADERAADVYAKARTPKQTSS